MELKKFMGNLRARWMKLDRKFRITCLCILFAIAALARWYYIQWYVSHMMHVRVSFEYPDGSRSKVYDLGHPADYGH
jgi:hypothetical protein